MTASATAVLLTACDREPVHIPGVIQPHGILLVLDPQELTIFGVSDNTHALVGIAPAELIGRRIDTVASLVDGTSLRTALCQTELEPHNPLALRLGSGPIFDAIAHRHDGRLLLDCEPASINDLSFSPAVFYNRVRASLVRIRASQRLDELLAQTAHEIRELTGFDRVIVYKFRPDLTGEVVAEAATERRYLGLRFPASDIPAQARALYTVCRLRLIPTSTYVPARMLGIAADERPVDMTFATLRSVSPVHLQYMQNMGVTGSMGISLVEGDRLWGLITCNHESRERFVPYRARTSCALIGEVVSSLIGQKEQIEIAEDRVRFLSTQAQLLQLVAMDRDAVRGLTEHRPSLLDVTGSAGGALYYRRELHLLGVTPSADAIQAMMPWLVAQDQPSLALESLPAHYEPAHAWRDVGCGLLAVRVGLRESTAGSDDLWLLWFRPELPRTVAWGGDPTKPATAGPLTPRTSFEQWKETVRLMSAPFMTAEVAAAQSLAHALRDVVLEIEARRLVDATATLLQQANRDLVQQVAETKRVEEELRRSNAELEQFAYVASHDLQEPLRMVASYTELLGQRYRGKLDDKADKYIHYAVDGARRMQRMINDVLAFSRVGSEGKPATPTSAEQVVDRVLGVLARAIDQAGATIVRGPLPDVLADEGQLHQLFQNLIGNALKFRGEAPPRVAIEATRHGARCRFTVQDNGIGVDPRYAERIFQMFQRLHDRSTYDGSGIGLTIAKRIVERHGGQIGFEATPGGGATFWFTLRCA
jgi:two-component system, chemotaxis family, sensor kinase Cph1